MADTTDREPPSQAPLVSILVLTWNQQDFIRPCIDSILAESWRAIEIVCCDNGSSDGTYAELERVVADHPDRVMTIYRNPPGTPVTVGFNSLLARAKGEFVRFFSGDDLFCGDGLARQVAAFAAHPELQVVYSNGAFLGGRQDGRQVHDDAVFARAFAEPPEAMLRFVFAHRAVMIQTMLARRSLIEAVGGFDEEQLADDWILNIRIFGHLADARRYAYLPFVSFLYRQHGSNAYRDFPRQSRLMLGVIDKYYRFPDRRAEMAGMFYFQSHVGAMYGLRHLSLALGYLREALRLEVRPKSVVVFAARLTLAPALRGLRRLRGALQRPR